MSKANCQLCDKSYWKGQLLVGEISKQHVFLICKKCAELYGFDVIQKKTNDALSKEKNDD